MNELVSAAEESRSREVVIIVPSAAGPAISMNF